MDSIPFLAEAFGQVLRSYRTKANLTQQDLATMIGSVASYIRFLEYGQRVPTLTTFHLICEALQVDPHDFMSEYLHLQTQCQYKA